MTSPINPGALQRVLAPLPPEAPDRFPHLANLRLDALLKRRVVITGHLKTLEQERQAIDTNLLDTFSDAELPFGIHAPGGWVLRSRSRTSWDYSSEVRDSTNPYSNRHNEMDGHNR